MSSAGVSPLDPLGRENIRQAHPQPDHQLLEPSESDALRGALQAVERRGWQPRPAGKFRKRHRPAFFAEKISKMLVERAGHSDVMSEGSFQMRNIFALFSLRFAAIQGWMFP